MTFIGTSFVPDNNCPCEEATVRYLQVHPGQWEAVIVSCPKNCEFPQIKQDRSRRLLQF